MSDGRSWSGINEYNLYGEAQQFMELNEKKNRYTSNTI